MEERCYQITAPGEGLFKDRGSKFLGFAYPVQRLEDIDEHLAAVKKAHYDARHHCYAYRLGCKDSQSFSTDDREPANSAGPPILAAIRAAALTNVLVVVVRYFGGTKLGIRGLIDAYRQGAEQALYGCPREEIVPQVTFSLDFSYEQTADIQRLLHPFAPHQLEAVYNERCFLTFAIHEDTFPALKRTFVDAGLQERLKVLAQEESDLA